MAESSVNGHFPTSDLELAASLRASGTPYVGFVWTPNRIAGDFIFEYKPKELITAWESHTLMVNARALFSAWNDCRDDLEDAKRRRMR